MKGGSACIRHQEVDGSMTTKRGRQQPATHTTYHKTGNNTLSAMQFGIGEIRLIPRYLKYDVPVLHYKCCIMCTLNTFINFVFDAGIILIKLHSLKLCEILFQTLKIVRVRNSFV